LVPERIQVAPPSTVTFSVPPPASLVRLLVMALPAALDPRRLRVLAPVGVVKSLTTLVRMSAPAPSAWICGAPVVLLNRILRSLVSPGPTYWRMAPPVPPLPMVTAFVLPMATPEAPTAEAEPPVLEPREATTSVPAFTSVIPA
jgi:hypothetical protein